MNQRVMGFKFGLIVFTSMRLLGFAANAQMDIKPYVTEADLGALIGEQAKVEGVFHKRAFAAPAIAISGRVFFLLENPPSNRTFDFPNDSRNATVEGTLFLYDGNQQYSEAYHAFGRRYYFFSLGDAKVEFGEPIKASGSAANDPVEQFIGSWRFDVESTEAEIYKFDEDDVRKALAALVEALKDAEMVVGEDRIEMYVPSKEIRTEEQYEVIDQSEAKLTLKLTEPNLKISREWRVLIDGEGRLRVTTDLPKAKGFSFFYTRW